MYDSNKIQYYMLGHIDFRNARYQGGIYKSRPHGLGIAIDYNHLFCLAVWREGKIDGPAFVVLPDFKILCGRMRENQLSGLSCFYLPNNIQTYINYSQTGVNKQNFITVLPAYRIILQIDCRDESVGPKATRYENYRDEQASQQQQLTKVFGQSYDLAEFKTWKSFLLANFIQPYKKNLYWSEYNQGRFTQYFIGFKNQGLGIRIIESHSQNESDSSQMKVSSLGEFTNEQELRGYGLKLKDANLYGLVEEGEFGEFELQTKSTLEYQANHRPEEALKKLSHYLRKSVYFKNDFLNLTFLYRLQQVYSKIDIEIVEETQKIAQVILHNHEESEFVIAEIQKKREIRKKSLRSGRGERSNLPSNVQNSQTKLQNSEEDKSTVKNSPPHKLANPEVKLTDAQRSIYSSVQKIKKESPERITKVKENFDKLFGDLGSGKDILAERRSQNRLLLMNRVNQSPPPRNGIFQQRYKYKVQTLNDKREQPLRDHLGRDNSFQKFIQNKYYRDAELVSYRKQKELEMSILNPKNNQNLSIHHNQGSADLKGGQLYNNHQYVTETYPRDDVYRSKSRGQSPPLYKQLIKDQDYSEHYSKIKEKVRDRQEQLSYDHNSRMSSHHNTRGKSREAANMPRDSFDSSKVTRAGRVKTPGKIRVVKRKQISEFQQFNP